MPDNRYCSLSPNGQRTVSGGLFISIDGKPLDPPSPGIHARWATDTRILYTHQPTGQLISRILDLATPQNFVLRSPGHEPSSLCVNYLGSYAFRDGDSVYTDNGRRVFGAFRPTWAGIELCWCVDTGTTADLYREGVLVAQNVHDVRGMPDGRLCYTQQSGNESWTCVQHPDGRIDSWHIPGVQEYEPIIIDIAGEPWVLSHTRDDRLLLRSGNNGVTLTTGATFEPDIKKTVFGWRVSWCDGFSNLRELTLSPIVSGFKDTNNKLYPITDLRKLPLTIAPYPPGKGWEIADVPEINLRDYLFTSFEYSRNGAHFPVDGSTNYTHHFQNRVAQTVPLGLVHAKLLGSTLRNAVWVRSRNEKFWGLAWDETDGKNGYRIVLPNTDITAPLYPDTMKVGKEHMKSVNVDILTPDGKRRNVTWRGYVEAVYKVSARVGDIFPTYWADIVWDFDDLNGLIEHNFCAFGFGLGIWAETRKSSGQTRRWIGTVMAPRVTDKSSPYTTAAPPDADTTVVKLPPRVNIIGYRPTVQNGVNDMLIVFNDANRPDERISVEIVNGSIHVFWGNSAGSDRSGKRRPITFIS